MQHKTHNKSFSNKPIKDTSWQGVAGWYNKLVGSEGHYYHKHVVLPGVLRLLDLKPESKLLDLGCGQGVLAQVAPVIKNYLGVDKSQYLIELAKKYIHKPGYEFEIKDVTKPLKSIDNRFTHATIILALQNMENPQEAIKNASESLVRGGILVVVLNHPSFRIPRQSGWGIDEQTKQQYRWVNRYFSTLKIPIVMNPGKATVQTEKKVTWSFHRPLQDYVHMLADAGFVVTNLEEWNSDKESEGKDAKMENRARNEFPLFLTLVARKE